MIKAIKHSWLTVIMLIVVCAAIMIGYTVLFVEDQYESECIIKTSLKYKTINKVIKSSSTYKAIDDKTGQIFGTTKDSLRISKEGDNITILVTTNQAILSKKIADGVIEKLESAYPNKTQIIKSAKVSENPSLQQIINNTIMGCIIGLVLGAIYIMTTYFYNLQR